MQPLVSIVIPITLSRTHFVEGLNRMIAAQTYTAIEVIYEWGETKSIGEKLNDAIERCNGEIIIRFDSDDNYGPEWIEKSVAFLLENNLDLTGLSELYFYDSVNDQYWLYSWLHPDLFFVIGGSMCFKKSYWKSNKFRLISTGEDYYFAMDCKNAKPHTYKEGFLCSIHPGNTSKRETSAANFKMIEPPHLCID